MSDRSIDININNNSKVRKKVKISSVLKRFNMIAFSLILALYTALYPTNFLMAQSVGVVLSGGGAKGLYHIGILKALEENGIPVDYVAGTSMGAIVAGMYAAGLSPEQMEDIFRSGQVELWLSGKVESKYQYYYKRLEQNGSMLSLDVNLKQALSKEGDGENSDTDIDLGERSKGVAKQFRSVIPSVPLDIAMLDYFSPASNGARQNFDSLFVPFRCVSVDILERKQYLWKEGDLGMAVRSSMAIPLVFKPIIVDSMMMFDGGILNNFPWEDMKRDFDPDIMIGGICTTGKVNPTTFSGQIELLAMSKTNYNLPDSLGIKLSRDVDVGMLDYSRADYVMELGYRDAMAMMDSIKSRIVRRVPKYVVDFKRLKFKERTPQFLIDSIKVDGLTKEQSQYVAQQLKLKEGETITFEEFKEEYFKIIEGGLVTGDFPTATYNPETGYFTINMNMVINSSLKTMLGVNISSSNINAGYLGVQYSKLKRRSSIHTLSGYLGNFYSSADYQARFNFYDKKRPYYINNTINYAFQDYGRGNNQRFSFRNRVFDYSRLNGVYANSSVGMETSRSSKIEFGLSVGSDTYKFDNQNIYLVMDEPNKNVYNYANLKVALSRNSLNYRVYPTSGLKQTISAFATYGENNYTAGVDRDSVSTTIRGEKYWYGVSFLRDDYRQISSNLALGYSLEAIYTTLPSFPSSYAQNLIAPGFYPTEHSQTLFIEDYHSSSFAAVGLKPIIKWNDQLYLKGEGYLLLTELDNLNNIKDRLHYVISASAVYQSPVGPVSFNFSRYENDSISRNYFTLNIGFIMFNRRGINYF
ncbi:MAG: patatin-like phospholipase family protein [Rikenellaceae bacterium]